MIELKFILEALLFAADRPLTPADLKALLGKAAEHAEEAAVRAWRKVKLEEIESTLAMLADEVAQGGRSYRLVCVAGAWQLVTPPEFAPWLRALVGERLRPTRLSQPALETLAIIAYRQPITRAEMEQIRGVSVDGVMQTLLERGLVESAGRAEVVGRPLTYRTTKLFLEYFGLPDLDNLPDADELRRIPVERPASLVTVEPGLATAPPDQLTLQPQPEVSPATPPGETPEPPAPASAPEPEPPRPEDAAPPAEAGRVVDGEAPSAPRPEPEVNR